MASYETACVACCAYILLTMPTLLIGFVIYLEAFFSDIRALFAQIDRVSERNISGLAKLKDSYLPERQNLNLLMLERCRDAVNLHQKVNR